PSYPRALLHRHGPIVSFYFLMRRRPPSSPLFPYTTLFRSFLDGCPGRGQRSRPGDDDPERAPECAAFGDAEDDGRHARRSLRTRSEEHTSELQSQSNLVCRLLLEKKKKNDIRHLRCRQLLL